MTAAVGFLAASIDSAEWLEEAWDSGRNPDLWLYRKRTEAILRKFFRMSVEVGRLPSILGSEFFRTHVTSYSVSSFEDAVIFVHDVERSHNYLLDPHTAVGVLGWESFAKQNHLASRGIVLATAHPAKFAETVARATGLRPEMPECLASLLDRPKQSIPFPNRFSALQEFLLSPKS